MFHDISANMRQVMRALEEQLARDQRGDFAQTKCGEVNAVLCQTSGQVRERSEIYEHCASLSSDRLTCPPVIAR